MFDFREQSVVILGNMKPLVLSMPRPLIKLQGKMLLSQTREVTISKFLMTQSEGVS